MHSKRASVRFIEKSYKLYEQKMYHVAYSIQSVTVNETDYTLKPAS